MRLFHLVQFVKCLQIFQKLNSKDCNKDQEEKKDLDVFTSPTKRESRHFHVVIDGSDGKEIHQKA